MIALALEKEVNRHHRNPDPRPEHNPEESLRAEGAYMKAEAEARDHTDDKSTPEKTLVHVTCREMNQMESK